MGTLNEPSYNSLISRDRLIKAVQYLYSNMNKSLDEKEEKASVAPVEATVTSLQTEVDNYYNFTQEVGTLDITLPVPADTTHLSSIVLFFETGADPNVTFTSTADVLFQENYSIEANKTYEVNCLFNGSKWIVVSTAIATE